MSRTARRLRLGAHTSIAGGLYRALERGRESGCQVVQIFVRSNQQWAQRPLSEEDQALWRRSRESTGVEPALVHSSYLINLAGPDGALRDKSYRALSWELLRADALDIPFLVMHPGAHCGDGIAAGIGRIAAAIDRFFDEHGSCRTRLLLENTAGQGTSIGHRFEHLRDIFASVRHDDRLGLCIDTCHTFAAGYDLRTPAAYERTFAELDEKVGTERVCAFHVNDSKVPLQKMVDRHEHIGRGHLGLGAFHSLVNDARFAGLPMTIETPKPTLEADAQNLAVLRALAGRQRVGLRAKRLATCLPAARRESSPMPKPRPPLPSERKTA